MKPDASPAAAELYEALGPAFTANDPTNDYLALKVCMALTAGQIDRLHSYLVDDVLDRDQWAPVFNPLTAPAEALPYLAQFSGAILQPEMDAAAQREAIQAPEAFGRGRPASIISAIKRRLTGTQTVLLTERYVDNPWWIRVETLAEETPDPDGIVAYLETFQKPIGIRLFFNERAAWTWGLAKESEDSPTWADVVTDFDTWLDYRTYEP